MERSMIRSLALCTVASALIVTPAALAGGWVTYANETSVRIQAATSLVVGDNQEKDYAWGDLDADGDTDLVVVRKQPFTTGGRDRNVLLMNRGNAWGGKPNPSHATGFQLSAAPGQATKPVLQANPA